MQLNQLKTPRFALPVIALLAPLALMGGQLFSDDFATTLQSHWTVVDEGTLLGPSNWVASNGVLQQKSDIYGNGAEDKAQPGTYLLTGNSTWTDYSVSVKMRTAFDDDAMGVMFGYQGPGNYYRFSMDRQRKNRRLVKFVNGAATVLAQDSVVYTQSQWYTVEAKMIGGSVEVWIDGSRIFQVNDVSHVSGKIALYAWQNTAAKFDDVVVSTSGSGGGACTYSIAPTQVNAGAGATTKTANVTAPAGCAWTASSGAAWLQVTSGSSGSGNGTVGFSIQANTSINSRNGSLTIAGSTLQVTQSGTGGPVGQDTLFSDNFAAGLQSVWSIVDEGTVEAPSAWQVSGGLLLQKRNIAGGDLTTALGTYLLTGEDTWNNYSVTLRMASAVDDDLIGVMFGYADPGNYYRFSMDRQHLSRKLVKFVDGQVTTLAQDNVAYVNNQWYAVEAKMNNGTIEIWIDGTRIFQVDDASHGTGKIALYAFGNLGAQYDDVVVTGAGGGGGCSYGISPSQANADPAGQSGSVGVTASLGCDWTATSNAGWLNITSGGSGSGDGTVDYSADFYGGASSRQGTLTIAGRTFTVTQQTGVCTYTINPTLTTVGPSTATGNVTVTTATGCAWNAASDSAWLKVTSGASGTGAGNVNYSVTANSAAARQGVLTIGGQAFSLTQLSSSGCQFTLTPNTMTLGPASTSSSVDIATTAGCSWTVTSSTSWISIQSPKSGSGNGKSNFTVQANTGSNQRQGSLSIGGNSVQITQLAPGSSNTFYVAPGASLQKAIDQAQPGDTITLAPGATYTGPFYLRKKTGNQFITITTANPGSLPSPGQRITPAYSSVLPKVISPSNSPVFRTDSGAHHYRLVGLEIEAPGWYNWDLVRLGSDTVTDVSLQASDLELDRLYIHGDPKAGAKRGVTLNSVSTIIKNCYISDIKGKGQETQAILGWNGPGPYQILNNYLEAAGENIMFGGATAKIPNIVPSDITIKGNHLYKPLSWRQGDPNFNGTVWTVKNIIELKNARRMTIEGNVFENCWRQAQNGFAIVMTVRTQGGKMPWAVVEDIDFVRNIVRHSGAGVNILGEDYNGSGSLGIARRLRFQDNIFEDIDNKNLPGDGRMVQVLSGAEDVTFDHNTFTGVGVMAPVMLDGVPMVRFVYKNNIAPHGTNGVFGSGKGTGTASLNYYAPGYVFTNNAVWGSSGKAGAYPSGNFFPADISAVKFLDPLGDYHLTSASPYRNAGTDNVDLGADIDAVEAATANTIVP